MDQDLFELANSYALQTKKIKGDACFTTSRETASSVILCDEGGITICRILKSDFLQSSKGDEPEELNESSPNKKPESPINRQLLHYINTTTQGKIIGAIGLVFAIGVLGVIFTPKTSKGCSQLASDLNFLRDQEFIWKRTAKMPNEGSVKSMMKDPSGIVAGMKSRAASDKAFEIWSKKIDAEAEMKRLGCEIPTDFDKDQS
jgi:hypothetical protein